MDERFEIYYNLLIEWNQKFNLTSITQKDQVELLHFKDSILPQDLIKQNATVLDIGSGAGFPSVPLKIVREDLDITMVDSLNKRIAFLNEVIEKLRLTDIIALHKRAEELDKNIKYDVVTARAVAPLRVLCEYCIPFVKIGGIMLAYKSDEVEQELKEAQNAIEILGGKLESVQKRKLDDIVRSFVIIKKIKPTPSAYPRGGNKPRIKPL